MTSMEPTGEVGSSRGAQVRRLRERAVQLEKRLARLERSMARQTEDLLLEMDTLIEELTAFGRAPDLSDGQGLLLPCEQRRGLRRHSGAGAGEGLRKKDSEEKLLGDLALRGVGRCEVSRAADGTWWVRVEEYSPFTLSPALARLLEVLCLDNGASDDHLIGWKSVGEVARLLRKRAANDANGERQRALVDPKREAHCVRQGLHRLRQALLAQQVNHKLVMVSRPLGVRFGLRHRRVGREGR